MKLKKTPELHAFLSTHFADTDIETDEHTTRAFMATAPADRVSKIASQARQLMSDAEIPVKEFGSEANRWFGDAEEARAWLEKIAEVLGETGASDSSSVVVKDSNGAVLAEGDSVQVIKDLDVKGGSSDLKRGTLIKKIHLVDDPNVIECKVGGSTLVLKTCFLKKA